MSQFKSGVQCKACQQVIISTYRHDYYTCQCGVSYIDGGDDYTRVGWDPKFSQPEHVLIDMINREIFLGHMRLPWNLLKHTYFPDGQGPAAPISRWPY